MYKIGQKLFVTPDSGFQMFFFPLMAEADRSSTNGEGTLEFLGRSDPSSSEGAKRKAIYDTIMENRAQVGWSRSPEWSVQLSAYESHGWESSKDLDEAKDQVTPCLRHRLGSCWVNERLTLLGLWLAIETNLGDKERGWHFRYDTYRPEHEKLLKERTPYVETSMQNLQPPPVFRIKLGAIGTPLKFEVKWTPPATKDIDVDLILDFGNSRTCALVLEHQKSAGTSASGDLFAEICRPLPLRLPFYSDCPDFNVEDAMVSSRFVLKTPEFRMFDWNLEGASTNQRALVSYLPCDVREVPKGWKFWKQAEEFPTRVELRIPNVFTKLSPVCFGEDVADMVKGRSGLGKQYEGRLHQGQLMQQSSAKRFFWDDRPLDAEKHGDTWSMMPNYGDAAFKQEKNFEKIPLAGLMLRFQPADGASWKIECPPNVWGREEFGEDGRRRTPPPTSMSKPTYPRRNTLTWSILAIMETAQRYINSPNWTDGGQATRRRRIRTVVGTYPSGWSSTELDAYRAKWQEALNIFTLTQFPAGTPAVKLEMKLDESVASQLPLLYSCIKSFTNENRGENWIQLNGVGRPGKEMPAIRVMNLDIGGGTTDVSIVEYVDEEKGVDVDLRATVKFRDSYGESGDGLLKLIIEEILFPRLAGTVAESARATYARFREVFEEVGVDAEGSSTQGGAQHQQARRTTQRLRWHMAVLIPLAVALLKRSSRGEKLVVNIKEAGIDGTVWKQFAETFSIKLEHSAALGFEAKDLDGLIVRHFGLMIKRLAGIVASFGVQMIFVCGKPSEQPAIRELVERLLPIPLERVHFASGFRSGTWYPFRQRITLSKGVGSSDGKDVLISDANERIDDAKTVTCVGAALDRAISSGLIPGWRLEISKQPGLSNHWGELTYEAEHGLPRSFMNKITFPASGDRSFEVTLGLGENRWIGRKMFAGDTQRPEPVYKLRWNGEEANRPDKVRAVFRRVAATAECADALELISVKSSDGTTDLTGFVKLRLEPVSEVSWLDTGRLFNR